MPSSSVVSAVLVPMDESKPLEKISISKDLDEDLESLVKSHQKLGNSITIADVRQKLLVRPSPQGLAGLYAYDVVAIAGAATVASGESCHPCADVEPKERQDISFYTKNIRATRLAMACGLYSYKLFGNVLLVRSSLTSREGLSVEDVYGACCVSPDLRSTFQQEMLTMSSSSNQCLSCPVPRWLGDALQQNYHDAVVLSRLAHVMATPTTYKDDDSTSTRGDYDNDDDLIENKNNRDENRNKEKLQKNEALSNEEAPTNLPAKNPLESCTLPKKNEFITKIPLCLHCRRPASSLCPGCKGCYFCPRVCQRNCRDIGWTHDCLCSTWKVYADRRKELSKFLYLDERWTNELTRVEFQTSEEPYEHFLREKLGIDPGCLSTLDDNGVDSCESWWSTELHGWAGGKSKSAKTVDISVRKSYSQGFSPLTDIPAERPVDIDDVEGANKNLSTPILRNALGFLHLALWEHYYKLRGISPSSPVALLCTFPLTVYYAIESHGQVPCTVARMLKRPLRIHIVGVEKEANFLDLFREVGFLLPADFAVEIVFVVREDMLPPKCRPVSNNDKSTGSVMTNLSLCSNLNISVVCGTYGGSLDPKFDCGTAGPPDMVMGLNAGLYAYESWRSVVTFLHHNPGIVGVFTDYNEYSGVNCAGLAGQAGRESLCVNPFRQPRAMPVYSMNLPQFSNGFLYVVNAQELE